VNRIIRNAKSKYDTSVEKSIQNRNDTYELSFQQDKQNTRLDEIKYENHEIDHN
jgi:hypothetical protein